MTRDPDELARAAERERARRWAAILDLHAAADGVLRWSSNVRTRFERASEWLGALAHRQAPASSWPWRRWQTDGLLIAPLTHEDLAAWSPRPTRPRWLDRAGDERWRERHGLRRTR